MIIGAQLYTVRDFAKNLDDFSETLKKVAEAALRQYAKGTLEEGEEILESTMEFYEMENVIKISVFTEVLEEIGEDRKIRIKK